MSIKIRKQLVSSRARTNAGTNNRTSITVHETANTSRGANAAAHANLQSNGNARSASWHYQVDDREVVQSFPDSVRCWHAGTATGNNTSIAIEICVNSDGDYDKALANAAALVRDLRAQYGLGRSAVVQHHNWSGKNCPSRLRTSGQWSQFVASTDPDGKTKPPAPGGNTGQAAAGGGKSVSAMASEVIAGKHGNGHTARRRSLGISAALYEQVRAEVNRRAGVSTPSAPARRPAGKSVATMASEVIDGQHGNGHANRRRSLGVSASVYEQVRAEVNRRAGGGSSRPAGKSVSQMATEVLRGDHGNGHAQRRRSLGVNAATYAKVRQEVNRRA